MGAKKMALLSQKLCYVMALLCDRLLYYYLADFFITARKKSAKTH